jgi:hypothetical protein
MYVIINKVPINFLRSTISSVKRMSLIDFTKDKNQIKNSFYDIDDYLDLQDESDNFMMSYLIEGCGRMKDDKECAEMIAREVTCEKVVRYVFSVSDGASKVYSKFYKNREEAQKELEKFVEKYNSYISSVPKIEI